MEIHENRGVVVVAENGLFCMSKNGLILFSMFGLLCCGLCDVNESLMIQVGVVVVAGCFCKPI